MTSRKDLQNAVAKFSETFQGTKKQAAEEK